MKIVVIGATGQAGSRLMSLLSGHGRETVAASRASGVDALTGVGLADAIAGATVVVDACDSPTRADGAVREFFATTTANLLAAGAAAGVRHHVALSVVGADRVPDSGYLRAKVAQEEAIRSGPLPYTILRATPFFELVDRIADAGTDGGTVRLPPARVRPVAADDVAAALGAIVGDAPRRTVVDIAGPEALGLDDLVRRVLRAAADPRVVRADERARFLGARLEDGALRPGPGARVGRTRLADWLERTVAARTRHGTMPARRDAGALLRRVDAWPHARVERRGPRATVRDEAGGRALAVLELETGRLIAPLPRELVDTARDLHPLWRPTAGGVTVDLSSPAGPAAAEALLRWRLELELFAPQALAASP